jgi:hypothetical protein
MSIFGFRMAAGLGKEVCKDINLDVLLQQVKIFDKCEIRPLRSISLTRRGPNGNNRVAS